ncbi:MAG TPA: FliG C-terminal domain-containing protein [Oligoflexus sp.]|uniref:FliG C-terminal domain-containing protein n=1 Tax=Oligoflexus sp. TaxID=1971216 RepID=UPI002D7EBAD7|nr:FliG C-terminal domain-containing protein [Oligoflexus sp.]HET9240276.1 FliG C-terminal domain-containing protein [Oligoflexus sp.]
MRSWLSLILGAMLLVSMTPGHAAEPISDRIRRVQADTGRDAAQKVQTVLDRYCSQHCQLLEVKVEVHETIPDSDELGFESQNTAQDAKLEVQSVVPVIQIDNRVLPVDRDRLEQLLRNKIKGMAPEHGIKWEPVDLPAIGSSAPTPSEDLSAQLENRLRRVLNSIIDRYCPDQCLLERIDVDAQPVGPEQLSSFPGDQVVVGKRAEGGLRIQDIRVYLTLDENLMEDEQKRILRLMKAQTRFVNPVDFIVDATAFPETALDKKRKAQEESTDPYGLEKLRQMLTLFRDLAGTKEVIQTMTSESRSNTERDTESRSSAERMEKHEKDSESSSRTESESSRESREQSSESNTQNKESLEKESDRRTDSNSESLTNKTMSTEEMAAYAAGFLLLVTLAAIVIMKVSATNRTAREMVLASAGTGPARRRAAQASAEEDGAYAEGVTEGSEDSPRSPGVRVSTAQVSQEKAMLALKLAQLKQDLVQQFVEQPRIARETFTRLLKDDGVAETAKYVHILGQLIVFELLNDSSLKRDLYELSEFYHRSNFKFDQATELGLLERLKTMVTASEIRLLASQSSDRFGFLNRLDAQQIFNLIADEKPRVQSIVLTQLDRKLRSSVFEMYEGNSKIKLLEELSQAEAIPREFLFNVAQALQKKIQSRSEFDTEQLRSSDILLDLLERSNLRDQRRLMQTLERNNPETARGLKLKLVTVEMLAYLKDGHLLEVILGMEREDLLAFLVGCPEHIRDILLRKAPEELAQSWIEDIRNIAGIDDNAYRTAEVKIKARLRGLANNGAISMLDINELIYSGKDSEVTEEEEDTIFSKGAFAA